MSSAMLFSSPHPYSPLLLLEHLLFIPFFRRKQNYWGTHVCLSWAHSQSYIRPRQRFQQTTSPSWHAATTIIAGIPFHFSIFLSNWSIYISQLVWPLPIRTSTAIRADHWTMMLQKQPPPPVHHISIMDPAIRLFRSSWLVNLKKYIKWMCLLRCRMAFI